MDETHYSISEAGKLVGVESHVLRYWEDELQLEIPRNGKSHRYYTELHIRLFQKIKELKEKGYQLKAIEQVLKKMIDGEDEGNPDGLLEQNAVNILKEGNVEGEMEGEAKIRMLQKKENTAVLGTQEKMEQFQQLMNHVIGQAVGQAIRDNNEVLSQEISRQVNDRMVQEMEYMMRVNDERQEERFKMLDEQLRAYQKESKGKAEAAATRLPFFKKKKFGRSGKKL
ncbi:MAG: MerR family transcriptional regulator [Lachnospiraceae bacterium]|jgi:DNA-binding transcriptional MerR regulator|nr:MerR family transcriptional regulator [Lachnospiraceae bacterium]MCI8961229.1 MerR family transcriptional regulator [Lachnospiraceae bacterium]